MNNLHKAAKQALATLENPWEAGAEGVADAIFALREALAEPVQEPVAWLQVIDEAMVTHHCGVADPADDYETAKRKMNNLLCIAEGIGEYFASPPQRKPLQDEEIVQRVESGEYNVITNDWASHIDFARAIERAHGIGV